MKGRGRKDRDDDRLFSHEAEADRELLCRHGWAEEESRPGWWRHRDTGTVLPEADALARVRKEGG